MVFERLYEDFKKETRLILWLAIILTTVDAMELKSMYEEPIKIVIMAVYVVVVIVTVVLWWHDFPFFMRIQTGIIVDIAIMVVIPVIISSRTTPKQGVNWYERERISAEEKSSQVMLILFQFCKKLLINLSSVAELQFKINIIKAMFRIVMNW
ncbi:uncharacterized protein LOC118434318 [Folsomia candida]|uniref:uncharacterized protein LOC118434318 n=1 Tax=Folsomia candida TaxID=158441 RepID=UPI001604DBD1|nr:uncharacterized protein LOC118434318 [Folsomia candida]